MIATTDLKNGATFLRNDKPYKVIKYTFIKMGRGGATVKLTAKNLESGSIEEISYSSNIKVDEVNTSKRKLQYLYNDGVNAFFIDPTSFEQIEIPLKVLGKDIDYVKEGEDANILFWDPSKGSGQVALSIEIPPKVTLKVVETDPGVKGNSATNIYKPAKLENGILVKVPLFIKVGESVKIDTRTGEYMERA